jgi:translation initiation factor 3 subunit B
MATNLEIFRVREKGVPVEVVDAIKDTVINFAWEPKGNRFVLITTSEAIPQAAVPPKTAVSFFAPEWVKGGAVGNFRHIRTVDKKNSNAIYWSPRGRFVVVAALQSQQSCDLDFWDLSFEKPKEDRDDKEKELAANLQLMNTVEHYGITDIEWDPTGRYVATVASAFRHQVYFSFPYSQFYELLLTAYQMENGYHLYDFKGTLLREEHIDRFKQWLWRPRPPTLLTKEEQAEIRKNLRNYSKIFDEQDLAKKNTANRQVVEARRQMLKEWLEWRESMIEMLREEGAEIELNGGKLKREGDGEVEEVEEIVEEIIEEHEEVVSS